MAWPPGLAHGKALLGMQFFGLALDSIQPGDALHGLGGDRALVFFNQLVELAPGERHASRLNSTFKLEDTVIRLVVVTHQRAHQPLRKAIGTLLPGQYKSRSNWIENVVVKKLIFGHAVQSAF